MFWRKGANMTIDEAKKRIEALEAKVANMEKQVWFHRFTWINPAPIPMQHKWQEGPADRAYAGLHSHVSRTYGIGEVLLPLLNSGKLSFTETAPIPARIEVQLCEPADPAQRG